MSNIVTQEQRLRFVSQIMANLVTPHTAMEDLPRLAKLAMAGATEVCKQFEASCDRAIGVMPTKRKVQ